MKPEHKEDVRHITAVTDLELSHDVGNGVFPCGLEDGLLELGSLDEVLILNRLLQLELRGRSRSDQIGSISGWNVTNRQLPEGGTRSSRPARPHRSGGSIGSSPRWMATTPRRPRRRSSSRRRAGRGRRMAGARRRAASGGPGRC